ncbi:MAG TPA: hypothetical protein VMH03_11325 [Terriglobales bacterium]|jgi:hypothetical protein|nr:hypothetical protein [Terriglobales bacterium]
MKDIHEVLRRKQAKYAQLGKHIEMLQVAVDKLREVAPLLADTEDDDVAVLSEVDEQPGSGKAVSANTANQNSTPSGTGAKPGRTTPRWP